MTDYFCEKTGCGCNGTPHYTYTKLNQMENSQKDKPYSVACQFEFRNLQLLQRPMWKKTMGRVIVSKQRP